jgi:hypothetical protein
MNGQIHSKGFNIIEKPGATAESSNYLNERNP